MSPFPILPVFLFIILLFGEFFMISLADGFSLEFERQKVSSSRQDSHYSGRS